ncbi:MAG: hypothetical protein DDT31_00708 [Syntrophomonadaceae bacterium]|nr:hypothetical protein [Bacillota bacterium]
MKPKVQMAVVSHLRRLWKKARELLRGAQILCDTCKYDWGNVCLRRERPNALKCPEYKKK